MEIKCPLCKYPTGEYIPCEDCRHGDAPYDEDWDIYYVSSKKGKIGRPRRKGIWMMDPDHPKRVYFSCFGCGAICTVPTIRLSDEGLVVNECVTCGNCEIHQWPKFIGFERKRVTRPTR